MNKIILLLAVLVATIIHIALSNIAIAAQSINIKVNGDAAVTLSQNNYNRILVKNDKIIEAVFPPHAMAIKRDEQDGSVYILLAAEHAFTLFLTTEAGRHFSLTLNYEAGLGKTIELVPEHANPKITTSTSKPTPKFVPAATALANTMATFISHMEHGVKLPGITVKPQASRAIHLKGLTLLPKTLWQEGALQGEIVTVYNNSSKPINLAESWFASRDIKAIKLSQHFLAPHKTAMLYRVGARHA